MYHTIQKTIAAWAFNHYIAYYYFDNVNVNQLKVAFEKGEVELEDLPIKKDALKQFNLPMEVVSGMVGKLSIKVPLLSMFTDSWSIKISNIMIIVAPKKETVQQDNTNTGHPSSNTDDSLPSSLPDKSHLDLMQENNEAKLTDFLENSTLETENDDDCVNSEETKLAEFYASFSATVSAVVKDIYKNIRLEIESMTVLFQDFDHGLVKFSVDHALLHRPKSMRNLVMNNASVYLSHSGIRSRLLEDDFIRINFKKCNLDIYNEASNNMQLVAVQNDSSSSSSVPPPSPTSEIKIDGNLKDVTIDQLIRLGKREQANSSGIKLGGEQINEDNLISKRAILGCDTLKIEFKLNDNLNDETGNSTEKNLHLKLDLLGLQYLHSQGIYEKTVYRLMNFLKFIIKLRAKKSKGKSHSIFKKVSNYKRNEEMILNSLFIINIEEGLLYIVDDTSSSCAVPLLEFTLDDCRILQFSGKNQHNGFVFAKVGCSYYNREVSTWERLLKPWPFNLSWDYKSASILGQGQRRFHKQISLNSDEVAEFFLTSAFFDLGDVALKHILDDFLHRKLWPLTTSLHPPNQSLSTEFNSIFVLHNETGHKLQFCPSEHNSELLHAFELSKISTTLGSAGDNNYNFTVPKFNTTIRSPASSRQSPDLIRSEKWAVVDVGEIVSFEYESLPVYRRHISDLIAQSRVLLVRVEGWKTLLPIPIDRTGVFFREACSDRVMNEDTYVVISINLEKGSARKIISIRSPLSLVNKLDATLEIHFVESNYALYVKPDSHLSVPLPYLFNRIRIRPCNVGVTMSEETLLWDELQQVFDYESKLYLCSPITITNQRHASYSTSRPFRICVSIQRDGPKPSENDVEELVPSPLPVFTLSFFAPLTLVNLLPCKIQYFINDVDGTLGTGNQQGIYHIDTTQSTDIYFKLHGFPQSKAIKLDPGATGSFHHTLEMFDKKNRILHLNAQIVLTSAGEEPAVRIIISAPYWLINKTRLPLIFKQEGAALEAAGQFREHEDSVMSPLMFSFYDFETEPPFLCTMRLGKSKGLSTWCEGFKLEKGSGERRLCYIPKNQEGDSKMSKSLFDINIRRGFGRYSSTMIVTLTARYGFDPTAKTPKKATVDSPQSYKLTSYNHNVNLAERIAGQAVSLFDNHYKGTSNLNLTIPGFELTLIDNLHEELLKASLDNIVVKCTTKAKEQILDCSIQDVRIENALSDCEKVVVLDKASSLDESLNAKPALRLLMDRMLSNSFGTTLFRQVQLSMCQLVLNIEEKLVLKLVEFMSMRNRNQRDDLNNLANDLDKILHCEEDRMPKYYFDLLRIDLSSLRLSVFTSTNLTASLQRLKSCLGLKIFAFEEAQVQLSPYFKLNVSRTFKGVFESVTRFYKRQILEQAPRIVGQQIQNYLRFHLSDLLSTLYDEVYNKLFN